MNHVHLRQLEEKDAPLMLEWMHDSSIACFFRFDALSMTLKDCIEYIKKANSEKNSRHFAIVNIKDEYLGTVSLKNIDYKESQAEYAISTRKIAHGTGAAVTATEEILRIAFEELMLKKVYLNVLSENGRANAFYQKVGFQFDRCEKNGIRIRDELKDLNWYIITNNNHSIMES